ncbi:MAG: pyrroline-5-carboxylate reductase [Clostridia bacterium]|nr:pyrroline-5-carboxylate reductase [Clostridia bacterium]
MKKIGFIGGGAMGEALIKGILAQGFEPVHITVSEKDAARRQYLQKEYGIAVAIDNVALVEQSEIIILAVKPQNLSAVVESFALKLGREKILVSILAGVTLAKLEKLLPEGSKVVRVMPNTPALIGEGTAVLCGGTNVTEEELQAAVDIFAAVGSASVLPENLFNAVTGLSGSGPAYVYLMIEALADGGVMAGLPRDIAYKLAAETVKGSAMMVIQTGKHPGQLKDLVCSPAGTTICGIREMEKAGVRGALMDTVLASARRAGELS